MEIVERLVGGDLRALARAISIAEEGAPDAVALLRESFPHAGRAGVLGITGAPGTGKSTLADRLVAGYRAAGRKVGVVAVDPSSAFSGGAILGDRIRMQSHVLDPGVFIRSMATRGHLGGLSRAANDAIDLMDAAGLDPVLVETVGVGQDEIEVVRAADLVAVVLVPGMGDDVQALKAGILEIADLFVINKADRGGADRLAADLEYMLSLVTTAGSFARPEIFRTVAVTNEGVAELMAGIERRLRASGDGRRTERHRDRAASRFHALLAERLVGKVLREALTEEALRQVVTEIAERRLDPYTAVEQVLGRVEVR